MIIYKCDGKRFDNGKQCTNTFETRDPDDVPTTWITIGSLRNGTNDQHACMFGSPHHFCSRQCMEFALFKNADADKIAIQPKIIKTAYEAILWMRDNMDINDESLRSDAFNIPTNAIVMIEDYFIKYKK